MFFYFFIHFDLHWHLLLPDTQKPWAILKTACTSLSSQCLEETY